MSYTTAAAAINQWIVQNGNNEITADVLRPVLLEILQAAKDTTGELTDLGTPTQENLVAAINYLLSIIPPGSAGVKVYTGIPDPNVTPPPSFQYADFYMQVTSENIPIQLWQWNGNDWVVVSYSGGGGGLGPLAPLEVRVFKKATGNTGGYTKETGDWVYGEPYEGIYWVWAIVGSDPEDYDTYTVKSEME